MAERLFRDRREAGRVLAGLLERYRGRPDLIVLGLPRGGVPGAQGLTEVAAVRSEATEVAANFDAVIHVDKTRAVEPLERTAGWERGEAPETYPLAV
jgi:hypothetical protein